MRVRRIPALFVIAAVVACAAAPAARAGAELVLLDGQVVVGESVERRADTFYLELATGDRLAVPAALVRELRLTGDDDPPISGLRAAQPQTVAGPPDVPDIPGRAEQVAVLGDAAAPLSRGVVDPIWRPQVTWPLDPATNAFNPARWAAAPIDPYWRPVSVFRSSSDVTQFNPARWYGSPIDPTWSPRDSFRRRIDWFSADAD